MRHRGDTDGQVADAPKPRVPKSAPNAAKPELPPLKEPPPKPATKNDPASNKVWFRLLDAETNRPIVNTPANFASFGIKEDNSESWHTYNSYGDDKTDSQGLFVGIFRDFRRDPRKQPKPGEPPIPEPACDLSIDHNGLGYRAYPLAKNYEPGTPPAELEPLLLAFAQGRYAEIIDVRLRRMRKVSGTVVDASGRPVPGAGVFAIPQRGHENDEFLKDWSYYYMDIPPNDEAWERPGTRTAKIIQRHFEEARPTISAVRDANVETRNEESRPDRFRYGTYSKWATFWTPTSDAQGRFEIAELPRGEWVVGAWHPAHGFITQLITLVQSDGEVCLALPNDKTASVDLTIEWGGEPSDGTIVVDVDSVGPYGYSLGYSVNARVEATTRGNGPWQFRIEGLREGIWRVASAGRVACMSLQGGERKALTFRCGPIVYGKWVPTVKLGQADFAPLDFEFRRIGEYAAPINFDYEGLVTQDGDPYFRFVEGEYEARIAGSSPIRFQVTGGATTETTVNIDPATISFSVTTDLAEALRNTEEDLTLTLEPAESAQPYDGENDSGFVSVANAFIEQLEDADYGDDPYPYELAPGRVSLWRIPRGVYNWKLTGRRDAVEGVVDLRLQSRIEFSFSNLPGVAVLAWQLGPDQSRDKCDAAVEFDCRQTLDDISEFSRAEQPCWTLEHRKQYLWSRDDRCLYLMAPAGRHVVGFECNDSELTRILEFPGTIQLSPAEFSERVPRRIGLEYSSDTDNYVRVMSICEDGRYDFEEIEDPGNDELYLCDGRWTLYIERRGIAGREDQRRREWGVMQIVVAGEVQTVDLRGASYAAYGSVVIELSGKAPSDTPYDPWWQSVTCVGIQALDIGTSGIVANGQIGAGRFNQGRPSLKPMLYASSTTTPPGRYKIIPWPGAPDSACKIVTVEPGKECVVRFEGR